MLLCSLWGWGQAILPVNATFSSATSSGPGTTPTGFTQNGLGGYAGSLKFDTAGDWLQLYFNGSPGALSFDIGVNNTFPSTIPPTAVFTIEESANGTNWTTLASYSNTPGGTKSLYPNTASRYVRWLYSTKPSGTNIALKNITLLAASCTNATASFASPTLNKTTADAPFTNTFTTNNTSAPVYTSSDTNVATVDVATGEVTIVGMGSATIKVAQDADETYCAVIADYTLNVTSATPSLAISGPADLGESCLKTATTTHTYTITNTGNSAANGLSVSSDNPQFVVSNISSTTVNGVNGTVTFDVTFTPAAAGAQNATLTVTSTTSGSNTATYEITGTGNATVNPGVVVANAVVTNDAATLHGEVTSLGSCLANPIVNRGFVYTVFSSPEINGGTYVNEGTSATGAFSVNISGLVPAKIYYYKAFVVDAAGQYYYSSAESTFTTSLAAPVATDATNVTPVAFTANWNAVNGAISYELDVYEKVLDASPNLVLNPGFENYDLVPWSFDTGMNQVISNSQVKTGTSSLFSTVTATKNFNQTIAVEDGKEYTLKFSYYIEPTSTGNGFRVWTTTGATLQLPSNSTYFNTKGSWTDVEQTFTASGSNLVLNLRLYNGVKIYFDDFDIRKSGSIVENDYILSATNVEDVTSYEVTGLNPGTLYNYVVRAVSGAVTSANSNEIALTTLGSPTWNGTAWSNTTGPDASTPAIIDGDYAGPAITAQSLTVNAGKTLTVTDFVSAGNVTNHGNIIVADGANFVQIGTFTAEAGSAFKVQKNTLPVKRLAYINWSSPLQNAPQTLKEFSFGKMVDGTSQSATGTVDNRFFTYNNNVFESVAATSTFSTAAGYLIRTPNDFTSAARVFHGQFEGFAPNSGTVTFDHAAIGGDFVLLGNPYPSAISLADFLAANTGTLGTVYVWNSQAEMDSNQQYTGTNYNTYSTLGEVPAGSLNGYLPVGQAFFVERGAAASPFVFTDDMRRTTEQGLFSKAGADRFWLELTTPAGAKPQLLLGFTAGATAGFDAKYDATLLGTNADALYTRAGSRKLVIDAHGAFSADDSFAVQADLSTAGNYTIGVLKSEGVFANGQQIWLTDHLTGSVTLISEQPYTFTAQSGSVAGRFTLQFRPGTALSTGTAVKTEMTLFSSGSEIHAAADRNITSLEVYDTSGRQLVVATPAQKETTLQVNFKGVVIVKALLQDGTVQTKKLMLK